MFDLQNLDFDINGDGAADTVIGQLDLDGDGIADSLLLDTDGNGIEDAIISDFNGDGFIDEIMADTTGDGILDTTYIDINNDGIMEGLTDINGDGVADVIEIDVNGDGVADALVDTDYNGTFDVTVTYHDTDGDGMIDTIVKASDYNDDGAADTTVAYQDTDSNGIFDVVTKTYDSDGDGVLDTAKTFYDFDSDGNEDVITSEQFIDTDGDSIPDTYVLMVDENADGVYDAAEIYDYDAATGALELLAAEELTPAEYQVLDQFDPASSDPADVIGDPAESMECWEYQGDTNRCAVFSQKFIIEELTGQEIDIEELADLAESNGWFTEEHGTPYLNMNKILDYYGVENEMSFHNDISDIQECLENGGKVIVGIDAEEIWYGETNDLFTPGEGANHAVEVIGIDNSDPDNPMVILNDSGTPDGCGEMVPLDMFLDAWEDSNCQMIACM